MSDRNGKNGRGNCTKKPVNLMDYAVKLGESLELKF